MTKSNFADIIKNKLVITNNMVEGVIMSVVIVGGNDCMIRKYKEICEQYKCSSKIFTHMKTGMKKQIGNPDLLVLFTGTMSHKMARCAISETKGLKTTVERSHSGSVSALKNILEIHAVK